MISRLCEYKALVNAYKRDIIEKSHFLFVNGDKIFKFITFTILVDNIVNI